MALSLNCSSQEVCQVSFHHPWQMGHLGHAFCHLWAQPLKTIQNINYSFYSFGFLSQPWCLMSHAIASHYFCVCAYLYHFSRMVKLKLRFLLDPSLAWYFPQISQCSGGNYFVLGLKILKSTPTAAARSQIPQNSPPVKILLLQSGPIPRFTKNTFSCSFRAV